MIAMNGIHVGGKSRWLAVVLALCGAVVCTGQNVLFIGNSFTFGGNEADVEASGGVPGMFEEIAKANGHEVTVRMLASGGKSWEWHLGNRATAAVLREQDWSHVVIQDFSTRPTALGDPEGFHRDGERFYRLIRELAPNAKVVLYHTWARAAGHPLYEQDGIVDAADMDRQLLDGYVELERALEEIEDGAQVLRAPVGTAFARQLAKHPELRILGHDLYHANGLGSYLAALVISGTILELDPVGSPLIFGTVEIDAAAAGQLQGTASELVGPNGGKVRTGMRPSFPFRLWHAAGDVASHAAMFANLTIDAGGQEEPRALNELGMVALDPISGSGIARNAGSAYWRNHASTTRRQRPATPEFPFPFVTAGVGVGGGSKNNSPDEWETISEGLRAARTAHPELFVALWVDGLDPIAPSVAMGRDGTVDLFVVRAPSGAVPTAWEQAMQRLEDFQKGGLLRKTIFALGEITDLPNAGDGSVWSEELLRQRMEELKRRFPEMPGVAFFVPGLRDTPEYRAVIALCDHLSGEYWPALPVPDGRYTLNLQGATGLRLEAASSGGVDLGRAKFPAPAPRQEWRVRRVREEIYELRPSARPDAFLAVDEDGLILREGESDPMGEWKFSPVPNGYRISLAADTTRFLTRTAVDMPLRLISDNAGRDAVWALVPALDGPE